MDRVVARHQRIWVGRRGTEHELGGAAGDEVELAFALLEHAEFARQAHARRLQRAVGDGHPGHVVPGRRRVAPALAVLQLHMQVVDGRARPDVAGRAVVAADHDPGRSRLADAVGGQVHAVRRSVLVFGRQGEPQLEAADRAVLDRSAFMPHAAAGAHVFDAAGRQRACAARGLAVVERAVHDDGDGGDAGMRVHAHLVPAGAQVEQVEEDEGFDQAVGAAGTDQACHAAARRALGPVDDLALRGLVRCGADRVAFDNGGHDRFLSRVRWCERILRRRHRSE
ncbi:conserved hypothetical protein [Ricinus communis]|uniref:Uncharacterized protein n=1 Tax=Ricinus communis TaxID=3988 RepID=B9TDQ7_RICCO|nr:conserved hypothetical protein [Ricinus communis]